VLRPRGEGELITLTHDEIAEAEAWCTDCGMLEAAHPTAAGAVRSSIAQRQSRRMEESWVLLGLPYIVVGGCAF